MVDLGFLLITFFVFTTTMAQPKVMNLNEPLDTKPGDEICNSCVLTVVLEKNNLIRYYEVMPENNPLVKQTAFSVNGIRKVILEKMDKVKAMLGKREDFVLIIKPGNESTMQNFVDIIDEV